MITDSWLPALITGLFGLLTGGGITYLGAILKFRKDLEARYDQNLHQERLRAYSEFWKLLEPLARHAPPKSLTPETLRDLLVSLRKWYFEDGGIYMSDKSRPICIYLKDDIRDILKKPDLQAKVEVDIKDQERLQDWASCLRAHLAEDVGTRKSSPVLSPWWSQLTKQRTRLTKRYRQLIKEREQLAKRLEQPLGIAY